MAWIRLAVYQERSVDVAAFRKFVSGERAGYNDACIPRYLGSTKPSAAQAVFLEPARALFVDEANRRRALFHLFKTRAHCAVDSFTRKSWRCKQCLFSNARLADEFNILPKNRSRGVPTLDCSKAAVPSVIIGSGSECSSKSALCGGNSGPTGPTASNNILNRPPAFLEDNSGFALGGSSECAKPLKGRDLVGATGFEPVTS